MSNVAEILDRMDAALERCRLAGRKPRTITLTADDWDLYDAVVTLAWRLETGSEAKRHKFSYQGTIIRPGPRSLVYAEHGEEFRLKRLSRKVAA